MERLQKGICRQAICGTIDGVNGGRLAGKKFKKHKEWKDGSIGRRKRSGVTNSSSKALDLEAAERGFSFGGKKEVIVKKK